MWKSTYHFTCNQWLCASFILLIDLTAFWCNCTYNIVKEIKPLGFFNCINRWKSFQKPTTNVKLIDLNYVWLVVSHSVGWDKAALSPKHLVWIPISQWFHLSKSNKSWTSAEFKCCYQTWALTGNKTMHLKKSTCQFTVGMIHTIGNDSDHK